MLNVTKNSSQVPPSKQFAQQCFVSADKFIKESKFHEARLEIEKAKKFEPANAYIQAFLDRISFFEQQQKKDQKEQQHVHAPAVAPSVAQPQPHSQSAPSIAPAKNIAPSQAEKIAVSVPPPVPPKKEVTVSAPPPVAPPQPSPEPSSVFNLPHAAPSKNEMDAKLDEMKQQIDLLTRALESEKQAREEMSKQQFEINIQQLRSAYEKAWVNGSPAEQDAQQLKQLALKLNISENTEETIRREVKLKMYGQAVKEVIAKRTLLRSSSSTLEWLRKVYSVSVQEYLEYESKFLLELVADQYRGTLMFVSADDATRNELVPRLKSGGFAVVLCSSPEDALEKIEKVNPNLIISQTEFAQGSLSGLKFLQLVRTATKFTYLPFILLAGASEAHLLKSSELRSNEGVVPMPVEYDELLTVINMKLVEFREYIASLS